MTRLVRAAAAAKVNLYLHVLGRRLDGYHELDSLVAFASVGDEVWLSEAPHYSLQLEGPFAGPLRAEDVDGNLVTRAVRGLAAAVGRAPNVAVTLHKHLPVASGIGGGSADAAATLRGLARLWGLAADDPRLRDLAPKIGADVPVCLYSRTAYFGGAGEVVEPGPALPPAWLLLVNPGIQVATKDVFAARHGHFSAAARFDRAPADAAALSALLAERRNDLMLPALRVAPEIGAVLSAIGGTAHVLMSRMSGSGATCFGLYADESAALEAAAMLWRDHPDWWVEPAALLAEADIVVEEEVEAA
jgi:4-diphosphocytidyl-2-C-methyl-D-erythritol kinase